MRLFSRQRRPDEERDVAHDSSVDFRHDQDLLHSRIQRQAVEAQQKDMRERMQVKLVRDALAVMRRERHQEDP